LARLATLAPQAGGLPEEAIMADPTVALVAACIGGFGDASKQESR
jgi:hypothetical protein